MVAATAPLTVELRSWVEFTRVGAVASAYKYPVNRPGFLMITNQSTATPARSASSGKAGACIAL